MVSISQVAIPIIFVALLIKVISWLIKLYLFWCHIREIPTAPGFVPLFGNTLLVLKVAYEESCSVPIALHIMGKRIREDPSIVPGIDEYGCFKFWLFLYPVIVITSPETASVFYKSNTLPKSWIVVKYMGAVIRGFFAMNGQKYRYHKKLLAPQFNYNLMQRLPSVIAKNGQQLIETIDSKIKCNNGVVDSMQEILDFFTIRVLLQSAMGFTEKQVEEHFQPSYINQLAHLVNSLFGLTMNRLFMFFVPDFLYNMTNEGKNFVREMANYDAFADNVFKIAKKLEPEWIANKTSQEEKSFLEVLYTEHQKNPQTFTREDFVGEFKTFFAAGFESMVTTMSWLFHFVGNRPDVQEKIMTEMETVFAGDQDRIASLDDIKDMKYMEAVVKECLRVHAVVPGLSRSLDKDYAIKTRSSGSEFVIPKYAEILLYQYIIQKDPHHWPDPLEFNPDRFYGVDLPHSHAFVAFSSGYRACMGQKYAMVVMMGCVSLLVRRYGFKALQELGSLVGRPQMSLIPEQDVAVQFFRRS